MSNKDTLAGLGIGIGVGLLIGGILGLLYAPKEGKETRQIIRDNADKFAKEVRLRVGKAKISDIK
ncbi:MAG: YtxH domain-containing protein [Patescibacteria group bacterium]